MRLFAALSLLIAFGCAHKPLNGRELDRIDRPAFISRIEDDAGPRAKVFREDDSYGPKLKKLGTREADRRLAAKLGQGATRFAVADRLRAGVFSALQGTAPYNNSVDPAQVASALETFLVEEVPADPPDYQLLKAYGADAIVEFVIEEYGMRSSGGRAGAFVKGFGRMFRMDGRELWYLRFSRDEVDEKAEHLDPFRVGQQPQLFGDRMAAILNQLAERFATELNPPDRGLGGKANKPGSEELDEKPDDTHRTGREREQQKPREDELPPGELPPPDAE